jgi:aryl-alcohol dehydrogenase-like predicted oxidoreductase
MADYSRRDLVRLVAAGSTFVRPSVAASSIPTRRLGKINFQAGILGLGAQHLGDFDVGQSVVDRLIGEALDNGLNYIDTAPPYNLSEERVGRALKGKRDKVFLVSKVETNAKGDALYQLRDSLRKLQTDHLDCVHIHNISRDDRYPSLDQVISPNGTLGALIEAKKQGMIRHIGCTSHLRPGRVLPAFETGEIELFMCTINFVERHIYGYEEKVLPEARRRNIGVIAMKVLGGPVSGPGARLISAEDYQTTLRYVWGVSGVSVAIIGLRTPEELRQALAAARSFKPFDQAEMAAVTDRGKLLAAQWGPLRGPVA